LTQLLAQKRSLAHKILEIPEAFTVETSTFPALLDCRCRNFAAQPSIPLLYPARQLRWTRRLSRPGFAGPGLLRDAGLKQAFGTNRLYTRSEMASAPRWPGETRSTGQPHTVLAIPLALTKLLNRK
jgi:hypothetical protein